MKGLCTRIYTDAEVLLKGQSFCSQFGDQLIADLGELLDLLILQVRKR